MKKKKTNKPIAIEIDELVINLDKSFIPRQFLFKGKVSRVDQEVRSIFSEGKVVNIKKVAGQEQSEAVSIRRDTFLLPNPVFSPYMVLTKKYRCGLQEKIDISAYIIPQMEVPATLEPKKEAPCQLIMRLAANEIELETNEEGILNTVDIPSMNLNSKPDDVDQRVAFLTPYVSNCDFDIVFQHALLSIKAVLTYIPYFNQQ